MHIKKSILKYIAIIFFSWASLLQAQEQYVGDNFKVTLKPLGQYAIISFELQNNAKFYWRNPGELGLPTKLDFSESNNLKEAYIFWPIPQLYKKDSISSYVYQQNTDFVVKLTPDNPNKITELKAKIAFSICQEGCSNYHIALSGITNTLEKMSSGIIIEALAKAPSENGDQSLTIRKVEQEILDGQHWLNIEFTNDKTLLEPQIFLDLPEYINFEPANFTFISTGNSQMIRIPFIINDKKHSQISDQIYLNLVADNGHAVEFTAVPISSNESTNYSVFMWALFSALLGGLILNIMPCVLPVLALKILQLVKLSQKSVALVRRSLIAQILGIISTFIFFAIMTYGLQFLGYQTGLGIHFQQPFYLITMILILSLISINLLSEKEIIFHVPHFIVRIFHIKSEQTGILGFFASGILSTLLAIPCAAPFVTIAIGFALTTDFLRMVAIFAIMGIGMSLPYILITIFPRAIKFLPKPGPWMITFKKILAIAIMATSLWLIYIISTQLGYRAAVIIFLLLLLIKFVLQEKEILNNKTKTLLMIILMGLSYFLPHNLQMEKQYNESLAESVWHEYEPSSIASLVKEGYIVVVNVSASWCATCGLNNVTTLENTSVINAMKKLNIMAMRADISKKTSAEVSKLMKDKNHHAIPFTIIYSQKHPEGIALPTILTPHILLFNIKKHSKD